MAKYDINFSCGHTEQRELFGPMKDRYRKIEYFEECGICSKCYKLQKEIEKSAGCQEIEMSFLEYKKNYADCATKKGSFDGDAQTIVVYVPKDRVEKKSAEKSVVAGMVDFVKFVFEYSDEAVSNGENELTMNMVDINTMIDEEPWERYVMALFPNLQLEFFYGDGNYVTVRFLEL